MSKLSVICGLCSMCICAMLAVYVVVITKPVEAVEIAETNICYLYPYDKVMERTACYGFWREIQFFTILDSNSNTLISTSLQGYIWQDFSTSGRVSLIWSDRKGNDYSYDITGGEKYLFSSDLQLLQQDVIANMNNKYDAYQTENAIERTWDIHHWDWEHYKFPRPRPISIQHISRSSQ